MQSKRHSHYEVLTNQAIGMAGGWMIVYFLFPIFSHCNQSTIATISSVIFAVWSYTRTYILRRYFAERT